MRNTPVFVVVLLSAGYSAIVSTCAHARGGGAPQMNWPGYQQRLQESRGQVTNRSVSQPYTTPPSTYSGKAWKKRSKRKK